MKLENYDTIFFDVGYTLCYPKSGNWRYTPKFYSLIDKDVFASIEQQRKLIAENKANDYLFSRHILFTQHQEYEQNVVAYTIISEVLPELNLTKESIDEIAKDRTYNMDNYIFYDGVKELFKTLSKRYTIGIISDAWPSSINMLKKAGLWEYIDICTLSCDIGICKPRIEIYEEALGKKKTDPHKSIFIDDVEKNLVTAHSLGMTSIKIQTVDKSNSQFMTINEITDLYDILL